MPNERFSLRTDPVVTKVGESLVGTGCSKHFGVGR